jgi:hypothetical protein
MCLNVNVIEEKEGFRMVCHMWGVGVCVFFFVYEAD